MSDATATAPPKKNLDSLEVSAVQNNLDSDGSKDSATPKDPEDQKDPNLEIPLSNTPVPTDHAFDQEALGRFDQWSVEKLKDRDKSYSNILSGYEHYVDAILTNNLKRQEHFYEISMIVLLLSPVQFIVCLSYCLQNLSEITAIVTLLASITEVLGVLLVIPQIIAKYLFNTGETTSINSIVSAIQNYDIEIRKGIRRTVEGKPHDLSPK